MILMSPCLFHGRKRSRINPDTKERNKEGGRKKKEGVKGVL